MYEDGWNVKPVRTWHAVLAVVAGNRGIGHIKVSYLAFEPLYFLLAERNEGTVSSDVVL
jgi:hypothetical protein